MGPTAVSARGEVACSVNARNGKLAHQGEKTYRAEYRSRPDDACEARAPPVAGLSRSSTASAVAYGTDKPWAEAAVARSRAV